MNVSTIYLIYAGAGLLALVSIILAVLNMIKLASTSSAINQLQVDIDKKTREFDAIKKENLESKKLIISQQNAVNSTNGESPKIEIVRNIRDEYNDFEPQTSFKPEKIPDFNSGQTAAAELPQEEPPPAPMTVPERETPPPAQEEHSEEKVILFETGSGDDDIMDVVGTEKAAPSADAGPREPEGVTVRLFSEALNYADFDNLWNKLSRALDSPQQSPVTVDLTNIRTFTDKEIEYLQKICQIVEYKKGSIAFVNLNDETAAILSHDPILRNLIRKV